MMIASATAPLHCPTASNLPSLRSFSIIARASASLPSPLPPPSPPPQRYAVIGAGFAGVAVAWHLLQHASPCNPIRIRLYDAFGIGAGGSGVAAGLLHPYTPRGKVLWQGREAFQDALHLIEAAESANGTEDSPFVWRHGLLRPARQLKQAQQFAKHIISHPHGAELAEEMGARCIYDVEELEKMVPGMRFEHNLMEAADAEKLLQESTSTSKSAAFGLFTRNAVVLQPQHYLAALWKSCQNMHIELASSSSTATFHKRRVSSLAQLEHEEGPFDGIVIAAGAAVDSIAESKGHLPLDLCQGYTLDLQTTKSTSSSTKAAASQAPIDNHHPKTPPSTSRNDQLQEITESAPLARGYPHRAPGLLGSPYIAPHGADTLVIGATQRHNASLDEALAVLGPGSAQEPHSEAWTFAEEALLSKAATLWPPVADEGQWEVVGVRSGVRALPQRTDQGSIPYAGKIPVRGIAGKNKNNWVIGGLGARGLVYHAWLGRLVAAGMVDGGSETGLPRELMRWKK